MIRTIIQYCLGTSGRKFFFAGIMFGNLLANGQQRGIDSLVMEFETIRKQSLREQIFVHVDRTFYLTGETLWFKVYCLDGVYHRPLNLSKVAYLEIFDFENKPVVKKMIALRDGFGEGSISLPTSILSGNYLFRGYTNWMKNFDTGFFYEQPITIVNTSTVLPVADAAPSMKQSPNSNRIFEITTEEENDNVTITVTCRGELSCKGPVYLLAHNLQVITLAEGKYLEDARVTFRLKKSELREGITHFTLFNKWRKIVGERAYSRQAGNRPSISVKPSSTNFTTRDSIHVDIRCVDANGKALESFLSMSVFKLDSLNQPPQTDVVGCLYERSEDNSDGNSGWTGHLWGATAEREFVPEIRGPFLTGKIFNTATANPAAGIITYLAAPGKDIRMYPSVSNANGELFYEVKHLKEAGKIVIETDRRRDSVYRIQINDPFSESPARMRVPEFKLSPSMKKELLTRSVRSQVQKALADAKISPPDSTDGITAFYGTPDEQYYLEDFTRFSTLEEILREYVKGVLVRKRKGTYHFVLPDKPHTTFFEDDPLVLVDGVPFFDIKRVLSIDPALIKRIDIVTKRYYVGSLQLSGIVSFITHKGDLHNIQPDPLASIVVMNGIKDERQFQSQRYTTRDARESRTPDFRNLLYWNAALKINAEGIASLDFYSSDEVGDYMIVVQGISAGGIPLVQKQTITITGNPRP
jgi:hypothetical protein